MQTERCKKVLIALHPVLIARLDEIAEEEARTRSELVREAIRRYVNSFHERKLKGVMITPIKEFEPQEDPTFVPVPESAQDNGWARPIPGKLPPLPAGATLV